MNPALYLELTKPRLVLLALLVAVSTFYMASAQAPDIPALLNLLVGSALIGGGANALNQFMESVFDARMARTCRRPIPSGRLRKEKALGFGLTLSLGGLFYLFTFIGSLTAGVGFLILLSYLFLYTPLKRKTPFNTLVGAVPGALPVLLGWTAVHPAIGSEALLLFLILFVWQIPHFLAIAWVYKEDYKSGGFKMAGAGDRDGWGVGFLMTLSSVILLGLSLVPAFMGIAGLTYLFMAIFAGVNLCGFACYVASHRLLHAKQFVYASIVYLFVHNISMVMDKA